MFPFKIDYNQLNTKMSDIEDINCTPPEIREKSEMASLDMLPKKSREKYERQHQLFLEWCGKHHITKYSENVVMGYFAEMAEKYSPPTLWSYYSMLKATLNVMDSVDIGNYKKLVPFLKQKSKGYAPKKSKTLSQEEAIKFLLNAPDITYLMMKVFNNNKVLTTIFYFFMIPGLYNFWNCWRLPC